MERTFQGTERLFHDMEYKFHVVESAKESSGERMPWTSYNKMAIVTKMKAIVPEFKSNNSVFTRLDAE